MTAPAAANTEARPADQVAKSTARTPLLKQALAFHQAHYPDEFGLAIKDGHYYPALMAALRGRPPIRRRLAIEPLPSTLAFTQAQPSLVRGRRGLQLVFADGSGAFRVHLPDGQVVHLVRCRLNAKQSVEYAVGTAAGLTALHRLCFPDAANRRRSLPRTGVWNFHISGDQPVYERFPRATLAAAQVYACHPDYGVLQQDCDGFFADLDCYLRYGQPGMRKVLLAGPPGTGKTTLARTLAAAAARQRVTLVTDGCSLREACTAAARARRPALIIAEEVDALYQPDSQWLSFLDGMATPRNEAGTYVIFSSNHPTRIDPRILQRPGRIDRLLAVGAFRTKAAAACARLYLPAEVIVPERALAKVLDRTTPAEIREIVNLALALARRDRQPLTVELIAAARRHLAEALQAAARACEEDLLDRAAAFDRHGPREDFEDFLADAVSPSRAA